MNKLLLIFCAGIFETILFTGWNLAANQKKVILSSILMTVYMTIYLSIIDMAFKDSNTSLMISTYALSCGIGNFIRVYWEKKKYENCKKL